MMEPGSTAIFGPAPESEHAEASAGERDNFSFMRHELCTPVNAILGYSEMLLEDAQDQGQDNFVPDLSRIHTAGKRGSRRHACAGFRGWCGSC